MRLTGWFALVRWEGNHAAYGIDIGFSKKVMNNKGRLSLGVDNLFFRPFNGSVQYGTVDLKVISIWDGPVVNAQFSYKFGNQSLKKKEKVGGSASDIIRRAQN